jgi:hypothetical protein
MDIERLSRFGSAVRDRATAARPLMMASLTGGRRWVTRRWRLIGLIIIGCLVLDFCLLYGPQLWSAYKSDRDSFTPFFTPIAALLAGLVALGQLRVAGQFNALYYRPL